MLNKPQTPASINKTPTRTIGGCIWTVSDGLSITAVNIIPMPSPVRPRLYAAPNILLLSKLLFSRSSTFVRFVPQSLALKIMD